jgi:glycosidase
MDLTHYTSPMADFGYDISDYKGIWPSFGTIADFDELLHRVHDAGMKLILDLVPNHSSDEHPWFLESRSSRDNPKRDWYIWHDPKPDGSPPNNWLSVFGGSAWEWDEKTKQYYYHERTPMQWDNSDHAGFTTGKPWLRVDKTWSRDNVQVQRQDKYSMLALYQRLIQLRQQEPSLMTFLIVLNLTHRPCYFSPGTYHFKGDIVIDTFPEQEQTSVCDTIDLGGDEGLIVRLEEWQSLSSNKPNDPNHPS